MNILFILLAIFILGVLIMVHELGHYVAARLLKFEIFEFAIGMGPKIFTKTRKGIKYSLRAIPFGGYVAFDNEESIEKGELKFHKNPIWKRIIVILAGPFMNILAAYLIVVMLLNIYGYSTSVPQVAAVSPDTPAYEAQLMEGDEFITANGISINGDMEVLDGIIQSSNGETISFEIKRSGEIIEKDIAPAYVADQGRYMVGVNLAYQDVDLNFGQSLVSGFKESARFIKELLQFLFGLITRGEGLNDVAGPVGSVAIIADTARTQDFSFFMTIVAFISMNLGVFNLLPIPPLDGSKFILFGVEAVRRKPLSVEKEGMIQMIGFALFIVLALVLTYKDIVRLVTGG